MMRGSKVQIKQPGPGLFGCKAIAFVAPANCRIFVSTLYSLPKTITLCLLLGRGSTGNALR
jgi:hypothetical protein